VDRAMNVWGSGGAHSTYFKVVDELIIEIFNRPIEKQPKGILDMGCGNGAFLQHLFEVIDAHTLRGKHLDEHPLTLVGVDYNEAALKITKANLIQADIWAKVIWGDIGDPAQLATSLETDYGVELSSLLNVRTFLDHNRPWNAPAQSVESTVQSSGAYASKGQRLTNRDAQQSFVEHMQRWQPYLKQHGLLVIELHTVNPAATARNLGKTGATAYDATHGYSDQYILEVDAYYDCIRRAGLERDERLGKQFPDSELATVTINLLK
jgi:SAM-dependent methyltransferase